VVLITLQRFFRVSHPGIVATLTERQRPGTVMECDRVRVDAQRIFVVRKGLRVFVPEFVQVTADEVRVGR
jgi:hypothetical protein